MEDTVVKALKHAEAGGSIFLMKSRKLLLCCAMLAGFWSGYSCFCIYHIYTPALGDFIPAVSELL